MPIARLLQTVPAGRLNWVLLAAFHISLFVFWVAVSQTFYGGSLNSQPVRLDATLGLWTHEPIWRHWFLFFLTSDDAANGVPYANMPYMLSLFYAGYHVVLNALTFGRWPAATTYLMTMISLCWASWFMLRPMLTSARLGNILITLVGSSSVLVTSPYVTGYLLQQNHDTSFPFSAIAATVLAIQFWRNRDAPGPIIWVALAFCTMSGLMGLVTLGLCFVGRRNVPIATWGWLVLFGLNIFNTLVPFLITAAFFEHTSASGFLFRTGLDGSTTYFQGHWQAAFDPFSHMRSIERALSIKLAVLAIIMAVAWLRFRVAFFDEAKILGIALLPYVSHWIVFPQSISIHPYLYDLMFLIPVDMVIVLITAKLVTKFQTVTTDMGFVVLFGAITLLLHDNLLMLAQGIFAAG